MRQQRASPLRRRAGAPLSGSVLRTSTVEDQMPDELGGYFELERDEDDARERAGFDSLSHAEQVIGCLTELEMEVNNGGFNQYYWNAPGDHALETVSVLQELGAGHTATLLTEANAAFGPGGPSKSREERWKQMDSLPEESKGRWFELDGRFDEYRDNLSALAAAYIRARRASFTP